jgi:hypothetical protein
MKIIALLFIVSLSHSAIAETISFQVSLDGLHAVPANNSSMRESGTFSLEDGALFRGAVFSSQYPSVTAVELFRANSATEAGTKLFDFTPGGILPPAEMENAMQIFNLEQTFSSGQVQDLFAGRYYVNISTFAFPNGEIRGQIVQIPEPAPIGLLIMATMWCCAKKRRALNSSASQNT